MASAKNRFNITKIEWCSGQRVAYTCRDEQGSPPAKQSSDSQFVHFFSDQSHQAYTGNFVTDLPNPKLGGPLRRGWGSTPLCKPYTYVPPQGIGFWAVLV